MRIAGLVLAVLLAALALSTGAAGQTGVRYDEPSAQGRAKAEAERRKAEEAKRRDEEAAKKDRAAREKAVEGEFQKARLGQATVLEVGQLKVGTRELVAVKIEKNGGERTVLVPAVWDKQKRWVADEDLVAALKGLGRGVYEVIHTEEKYGLEWVTGVGEDSPRTLDELARSRAAKKPDAVAGAAKDADGAAGAEGKGGKESMGKAKAAEPATLVAVGRFVKLADEKIDGKAVKAVVIERGVQLEPAVFFLAAKSAKGAVTPAKKDVVQAAEKLAPGAAVRIEYVEADGKFYATSVKATG